MVSQVNLIKSFDDKRFVWPHIMDEVSRALPPYTWVTSMLQTNVGRRSLQTRSGPAAARAARPDRRRSTARSVPRMQFKLVGNTVDIQALTRFMKVLEASPFIENVQLESSDDHSSSTERKSRSSRSRRTTRRPHPSSIKTVPVSLSVR